MLGYVRSYSYIIHTEREREIYIYIDIDIDIDIYTVSFTSLWNPTSKKRAETARRATPSSPMTPLRYSAPRRLVGDHPVPMVFMEVLGSKNARKMVEKCWKSGDFTGESPFLTGYQYIISIENSKNSLNWREHLQETMVFTIKYRGVL